MWKVMHAVAATAPTTTTTTNIEPYVAFYRAVGHTLPCPHCRQHYLQHLQSNPLVACLSIDANYTAPAGYEDATYGNMALQRWVHNLHNEVNERLNKRVLTFEQSLQLAHNSCAAWVTPSALADPFYSRGSNWMTQKQNERLSGRIEANTATASLTGSNIAIIAVLLCTALAVVVTITTNTTNTTSRGSIKQQSLEKKVEVV